MAGSARRVAAHDDASMLRALVIIIILCFGSVAAAFGPSRPTTTVPMADPSGSFWDTPSCVERLPDPPSVARLSLIQSKPYRGGFEPTWDGEYETEITFGRIPEDLVGSLASVGPGRLRVGDRQYGHWFDGDGYCTMLSLDGRSQRCSFKGRYVRTQRFRDQEALLRKLAAANGNDDEEEALEKPPLAFSGAWTLGGTGRWFENLARSPTNPANTATLWLPPRSEGGQPRLYALCEGGHPIEMDPSTLETVGTEQPFVSSTGNERVNSFFSAHFSRCPYTNNIFNHGYVLKPGPGQKYINLVRLDPNGNVLDQASAPLPSDTFIHDAAMSQNHIVYFLPPYLIPGASLWKFLIGQSPFGGLYQWKPDEEACYVHVHSKDDLSLKWIIPLPKAMSLYHIVDAHEEKGDDTAGTTTLLKVRVAELQSEEPPADRISLERQFADQYRVEDQRLYTKLHEYTFSLTDEGVGSVADSREVGGALCEFPTVNASFRPERRRRFAWTNAASSPTVDWLDGIQKIDMETGASSSVVTFGEGSYSGAPAFVPKEGAVNEDEGYLIATVYRSTKHTSDAVILDASTMEVLCIVDLGRHVPYQFHGDYLPGYVAGA